MFNGYSSLTFYILRNLRTEESLQFKEAMIKNLQQDSIDEKVYLNAKETLMINTAS